MSYHYNVIIYNEKNLNIFKHIKRSKSSRRRNAKVEQDPRKKSPNRCTLSRKRKIYLFQATPSVLADYNYIKQFLKVAKEEVKETSTIKEI